MVQMELGGGEAGTKSSVLNIKFRMPKRHPKIINHRSLESVRERERVCVCVCVYTYMFGS